MKKIILTFFILSFLNSCQYFDKQVPSEAELLEKELKAINWNEVDEFPSVMLCDSLTDKDQRKQCFFDFLTHEIQQRLSTDTLTLLYPEIDTVDVKVTVFPDSAITFEPSIRDTATHDTIKVDSIIKVRLSDFPKINPALKRGIPVKTQFVLPVIIKME